MSKAIKYELLGKTSGSFGYIYHCWNCKKPTKSFWAIEGKNELGEKVWCEEIFCTKKCFEEYFEKDRAVSS